MGLVTAREEKREGRRVGGRRERERGRDTRPLGRDEGAQGVGGV